jgi:predicted TIM-barrel fold metal-dependent hydrolase
MRSPSKGFSQLHSLGLSFDLQANPSQLQPFASAYANLPDAPDVIIDHM